MGPDGGPGRDIASGKVSMDTVVLAISSVLGYQSYLRIAGSDNIMYHYQDRVLELCNAKIVRGGVACDSELRPGEM